MYLIFFYSVQDGGTLCRAISVKPQALIGPIVWSEKLENKNTFLETKSNYFIFFYSSNKRFFSVKRLSADKCQLTECHLDFICKSLCLIFHPKYI